MTFTPEFVALQSKIDPRGWLVVVEHGSGLPFDVARVYFIGGCAPGVRRGGHAHHLTRQAVVCVAGTCRMLLDDGRTQAVVTLDDPTRALLVPPTLWHEMYDFSEDCVLLVFADRTYEEADYIRDRERFSASRSA